MTARGPKVHFVLTLEGAAGADTAHIRTLRFLLKFLLRSRSLHCTDLRELDDDGDERCIKGERL